ncbi:MAG: MFS transporter [Sandarakinorhabdus sp.]|nr:MFS transporter [Sandarakinorhabdus sp.]
MRSPDTSFFGHPAGLGFLAFTQAWERFSFYGMQALLPLYLVDHLLEPDVAAGVAGLTGLRAGVEALTGPLSTTAFAAQLFGLYIGLFNIAPLALGWLADGLFGQRRLVLAGLLLMAAGHLAMAVEALFLPALALLLLGGGCLKGNLYAQVGMLYAGGDGRRTRAYAIHLMALNVGSILAPLICGTLGERVGWHWGFTAAGIGMLLGLAIYVAGTRHLPPDNIRRTRVTPDVPAVGEAAAITAIVLMLLPFTIVYAAAMQAYNLLLVWAQEVMDRDVAGFEVPVTWLLTYDGLMTIVGIFLALRLWAGLGRREPDAMIKLAVAGLIVAAAWSLLAVVTTAAAGGPVSMLLVLLFFALLDLSYGWLDPPANSFVSVHAPARLASTLMSLNIAAFGAANIASGWLGRFQEPLGPAGFWWLLAAVGGAGAVVALLLRPLVVRLAPG